ncbi:MAG: prolyl oligopeptidase family serine peptidase [Planctomycetota bacterium]
MPTSSQHLVRPISKTAEIPYLLHLPEDYAESAEPWPLILHLHGAGERGTDLEKVRTFGLARVCARNPKFPFVVVSPQCPENDFWRTDVLFALLDDICEKYNVDVNRVYVTGASMGGYGTWALAAHDPKRFAAIAPICGRAAGLWVWNLTALPIWVFHGDLDPIVPLDESKRIVESLQRIGNPVKFTIYPRSLHDVWTRTYRGTELFEWFLTHRRPLQ